MYQFATLKRRMVITVLNKQYIFQEGMEVMTKRRNYVELFVDCYGLKFNRSQSKAISIGPFSVNVSELEFLSEA